MIGLSDIIPGVTSAVSALRSLFGESARQTLPPAPAPPTLEEMEALLQKTDNCNLTRQGRWHLCYTETKVLASIVEKAPYRNWTKTEENYRYAASHALQKILGDHSVSRDENDRCPSITDLCDTYSLRQHIIAAADDLRGSQATRTPLILVTSNFNQDFATSHRYALKLRNFVKNLSQLVEEKYPHLLPEEKSDPAPEAQSTAPIAQVIRLH